jgi:hypothetical protein
MRENEETNMRSSDDSTMSGYKPAKPPTEDGKKRTTESIPAMQQNTTDEAYDTRVPQKQTDNPNKRENLDWPLVIGDSLVKNVKKFYRMRKKSE